MRVPVIVTLVLAACAGDSPPPTGRCTGQFYDACNTEDDCDGALCQNFVDAFQVCSQTCGAGAPVPDCPDGGTCDEFGVCKPAAPNECTL